MARARNIKPSLFKNELLGAADPMLTLLFVSLWTLADKNGRLEDRPLRIKAETFPYRDNLDVNGYLTVIQQLGFIDRYEVDGLAIIQVVNFRKHQSPHHTEKDGELPEKPIESIITVKSPLNNHKSPVPQRSDSLIPDSLIPDSLIPDSRILISELQAGKKPATPKAEPVLQAACHQTWKFYSDAYFNRYQTEPVRNVKVSSQIKQFVQRIGYEESPHVAAYFVGSNSGYYVGKGHTVGLLLADAEKLRTEWATGKSMTGTRARQIDQSQANSTVADEALIIYERIRDEKIT